MAIRSKNLDLESDGMKRHSITHIDAVSATVVKPIFAAPYACVVESIDLYTKTGITENTSQSMTVTARIVGASDSTLQVKTDAISANVRLRLTPSANNSLSTGAALELAFSATCQTLSGILCVVKYKHLTHREST